MQTAPVVILDRDGVINEDSDNYIKSPDDWFPIPGSIGAISRLTQAGVRLGVATNQSGLARGLFDEFTLAQIHQKMLNTVEQAGGLIEAVCYCPHHPDDSCRCRKPETGLLEQLSEQFARPLDGVPFVGDSLKDIQAARKFSMQPVLVRSGKGKETEQKVQNESDGLLIFDDLSAFAEHFLG